MHKVVCRWATFGDIGGDIGDIQGLGDIGDIGDIALATFPSGDIGDIGLATLATLGGDIQLWPGFGLAWALAGWVARASRSASTRTSRACKQGVQGGRASRACKQGVQRDLFAAPCGRCNAGHLS